MKKTAIVLSATLVAALATLAGCNPTGSSEVTYPMPYKISEVVDTEGTYVTTFTYAPNTFQTSKESKTLNGAPYSEKSGYTYSGYNYSYVLTSYKSGGTTYERIAYEMGSSTETLSTSTLASATDTSGGTLTNKVVTTYTNLKPTEVVQTDGSGTVTLRNFDYNYDNYVYGASAAYYTYKQSVAGGAPVTMCFVNKKPSYNQAYEITGAYEYEIYKNWVSATSQGTLVESKTEYKASGLAETYTVKQLDETTGTWKTTKVSGDYENITVRN